ncbi:hypothetical protein D0Z07_4568 [Hyphodiscus hymeniophilus]|uniref:Hemerythrin-like domain-containing protein n=1 Tax=Hyphodiscus hymeniophilus TaxID=353542 RepID=A0A9P6VKZ4_9HELO|nr:hypothetical protein D0Z07_4568 [Hyphodiscus hymeniophilus]
MGGKSSKPVKQWADSPFKIIETPLHKRGTRDISKESGALVAANVMALVHNCIIRALNCIYLQAPNVKNPVDVADFLKFMRGWSLVLHMHHETEEDVAFPLLEEMIGLPGFMEKNVEQHKAFGPGMEEFDGYVKSCEQGKETFDGVKVRQIIDGFGEILTQHLTDEIDAYLALEEYDSKINWDEYTKKVAKKSVDEGDTNLEVPCFLTNMECGAEGGIHDKFWPPVPWYALLVFRWWFIPKNKGAWRFSSCDSRGYPKDLPFSNMAPLPLLLIPRTLNFQPRHAPLAPKTITILPPNNNNTNTPHFNELRSFILTSHSVIFKKKPSRVVDGFSIVR